MERKSYGSVLSEQNASLPSQRGLTCLNDQDLLALAQSGEQDAFEHLVERYRMLLLHFIIRYIRSQDEALDILQHVLLRFYLSLPTLSATQSIKSWLFRVAHNCSIDALRKKHRHLTLPFSSFRDANDEEECSLLEAIPDSAPSPQEQIEQLEQYD